MANKKGPYFVRIAYHSAFGPHSMEIQTNTWNDVASTNNKGQFTTWNEDGEDAQDAIEGLVGLLQPFFRDTVIFDNWLIFHFPADGFTQFPVAANNFTDLAGTGTASSQEKATQRTLSFRTDGFGAMKVVLLDCMTDDGFDKISALPGSGRIADLAAEITSPDAEWAGRDNLQVESFVSSTTTLNEKLRRAYRMT